MHNNNNRLRRSSRSPVILFPFAVSALVSACQSVGPAQDPLPAAVPVVTVAPSPLEPIVLPALEYREPVVEPDLLVRLRSRFALEITPDPVVQRERDWYARNQTYLDRVFKRGELYLFHIAGELEARGMPAELALLPIVESAFDPFAYSHGRAAGLWQIIPGTGKRLGLAQNWWFDGRRDVLESTRAALDYLQQLHERFDGDWLLAVAGYNSGEGNVARALKKAAAAGHGQDFWGIKSYLPAETRTYVPRLLAIAELVGDPAAVGVTLPELRNEAQFAVVETGGQIDMALAAQLAGIDTDALYALNPGINRWATDPEGPHRLLLPLAQADLFTTSLAALGERELVQWTRHRVRAGETVGGIAERYQTTVAVLREINGAARQFDPRRRVSDDPARQPVGRKLHAERRCACRSATEHAAQRRAARARRSNRRDALVDLARVRRGCAQSRELELDGAWRRAQHRARARRVDRSAGADRGWRHGAGVARSARIRRRASRRPTAFARSRTSCAAATPCRRSHGASKCRSASSWSGTRAPPTSICSPVNASRCSSTSREQSG